MPAGVYKDLEKRKAGLKKGNHEYYMKNKKYLNKMRVINAQLKKLNDNEK